MALLKKIRSATLMESLVATVLVVILFMIASLILNTVIVNTYKQNTHAVETRLNRLEYEIQHHMGELPHDEKYQNWQISIKQKDQISTIVILAATNDSGKKEILRELITETKVYTNFE